MFNLKLWSTAATVTLIAGVSSPAVAQEVSTSAAFTLSADGGVTSVIFSSAVSDTFAFSEAASNTGGVYTSSFAASEISEDSVQFAMEAPVNTELGEAITTTGGATTVSITGPVQIDITDGAVTVN